MDTLSRCPIIVKAGWSCTSVCSYGVIKLILHVNFRQFLQLGVLFLPNVKYGSEFSCTDNNNHSEV